jgi:phosphatidylethanolamine/phosphatidyl-N-methylethanolamine N-methyltransferase
MRPMQFLRQFMHNPTRTGAIAPSSTALAELITASADLAQASVVIEFGPGTGVFTEQILAQLHKEATFFALEVNPDFVAATQARCPEAIVYHDSATQAGAHLKTHGHTHCDCIISGLPWAAFGEKLQDDLLDTVKDVVRPGGRFLTFAYLQGLLLPSGLRFRKKLKNRFSKVSTTRIVWANLPPALVYCVEK